MVLAVFPFDFPAPTAGYLTLYVLTFAIHQLCMHYVLAGTVYVAWSTMFPGRDLPRDQQPLAQLIRDWLPFLLSAAITAGVAPLLFVQIVYPRHFYTANLLLGWKWMIVVPVLIVAFYLLYLLKSNLLSRWSFSARSVVPLATAACFVFVGFCWTSNHLLGNVEDRWPEIYRARSLQLPLVEIVLRMGIWASISFVSLTVFTAWQLRSFQSEAKQDIGRSAKMAVCGSLVTGVAGIWYLLHLDAGTRGALLGLDGAPYLGMVGVGLVCQFIAWWRIGRDCHLSKGALLVASLGLTLVLTGGSALREIVRVQQIDITALYSHHAEAGQIGGIGVFLLFAVVNTMLIGFCIWCTTTNEHE